MLDNVTGNIPGSAVPEGRVERCEKADVYCQYPYKVCLVSEPSWRGFSDQDAVKVFQGTVDNPITEAQNAAVLARAEALRRQRIKEAEENGAQARINAMRVTTPYYRPAAHWL